MPITPALFLKPISDDEFAYIDKAVMRKAYEVQNKFGRLFDERVYENDLAARLRNEGFEVHTQVPILVTHADFRKTYYLDLIVNHMLYELKVVASLASEHDAQSLQYAMLQEINFVKLLNFGEKEVRGKLLRNAIGTASRHQPMFNLAGMQILSTNCERLLNYLTDIAQDWGTHLTCSLYNEALVYFFGGEEHCAKRMELKSETLLLGTHRVQCHADNIAFIVTMLSNNQSAFNRHLNVLLSHTKLRAIQWINLNHCCIDIATIQ